MRAVAAAAQAGRGVKQTELSMTHGRDVAIANARRNSAAADNAASAVVIYDLQRVEEAARPDAGAVAAGSAHVD